MVIRFLAVFIFLSASLFGQQLYPHKQENSATISPTLRVAASPTPPGLWPPSTGSKSLDIHLRAFNSWNSWIYTPGPTGGSYTILYKGDFVGHFWVVIDFNIATNPPPNKEKIPNLYGHYYPFDWDLVMNEELHLPTPVQPSPGPYWYNFWFSQTLAGTVAPSVNLFPEYAASIIYDVAQGGFADIPIARFVYPTALQGTWVQIHVIGNMWHEVDGQGWVYLNILKLL